MALLHINDTNTKFTYDMKLLYMNYLFESTERPNKKRFDYSEMNNNIQNIKRLRVTKGICLPSDIDIHVIRASKDVIHS
jgi:hypothetical protein